jgi:hypothetical protein
MTETRDPRRILEEHHPALLELEQGLRELRSKAPSAAQLGAMRAALGLSTADAEPAADVSAREQRAPAQAAAGDAAPAPAAKRRGAWLTLLIAGALLAAALGVQSSFFQPRSKSSTTHHTTAPSPEPRQTSPTGSEPEAPNELHDANAAGRPSEAPSLLRDQAPRGAALVGGAQRAARLRSRQRQAPAASAGGAADQQAEFGAATAELELLKRAKAYARSNPARALVLVAEHERRFSDGVLVQEREVIAIEALLAAGPRERGELRAARFFERFPGSVHRRRIEALLSDFADTDPPEPRR